MFNGKTKTRLRLRVSATVQRYKPRNLVRRLTHLNVGLVLGHVISLVTFVGILTIGFTTWYGLQDPQPKLLPLLSFPNRVTWTIGDWFLLAWVLAATLLVTFQPGKRIREFSKESEQEERSWVLRYSGLTTIRRGGLNHAPKADPWVHLRQGFEQLLCAAHQELEIVLKISDKNLIKLNLLVLTQDNKLAVIARSRPGSPVIGVSYPYDDKRFTSAKSISLNAPVVDPYVKEIRGEGPDPYDPDCHSKPYNCVAAVPIALGTHAYGAISVDSKNFTTFKGREAEINAILRPCAAEILLGLPNKMPHRKCPRAFH